MPSRVWTTYGYVTEPQSRVINQMRKGAIIQTNKGLNYKAWLLYPDGTEKRINRDTILSLFNRGIIKLDRNDRFDYVLSK